MRVALVNAGRINFDGRLSLTKLEDLGEVVSFAADPAAGEIIERAAGAIALITKEIPVSAEVISGLPGTVKLINEAGTGYNNIDLAAARERGITVCNVPDYSGEAVAHLVITSIMNFSCGMVAQQKALARGDRRNFQGVVLHAPHFELRGKVLGLIGGNGAIGQQVATIARALGLEVLIWSR